MFRLINKLDLFSLLNIALFSAIMCLACTSDTKNTSNNESASSKSVRSFFDASNRLHSDSFGMSNQRPVVFKDTINVKEMGIVGDGKTDVTSEINKAIAVAVKKNAVLFFPSGEYVITGSGILLVSSNICLLGDPKGGTIFIPGNNTNSIIQNTKNAPAIKNVTIKFITFKCVNNQNSANYAIRLYGLKVQNILIDSCHFEAISKKYIQSNGIDNLTISNCLFINQGEPVPKTFFIVILNGNKIQIIANDFIGYYQGLYVMPNEAVTNLLIKNNEFDGRWYLTKDGFASSGNGIKYTNNELIDQNINFSNITKNFSTKDITKWRLIRVLFARGKGKAAINRSDNILIDSKAQFDKWNVIPGEIVEVGDKRGIIEKVISDTKLSMEYWYNKKDMAKVKAPQGQFVYTLYGIYLSSKTSGFNSHVARVNYWHNLDGEKVIPSNGSRYELVEQLPMYGLQLLKNATSVTIDSNRFLRNYADQISVLTTGRCIVKNNYIRDGQDMGITLWNRNDSGTLVTNNYIIRQGSCGITINGNNNKVNHNIIEGPIPAVDLDKPNTLGGIALLGGKNNLVENNLVDMKSKQGNGYGIIISKQIDKLNNVNKNKINNMINKKEINYFDDSRQIYNGWQFKKK